MADGEAKAVKKELTHFSTIYAKYKNLLRELTRKNVKLKYRDSWLGIFWSYLQPLLNMIVLAVVFGGIFGKSNKHVICYPVYLFTGRLLHDFFTSSTKKALRSFRENQSIIKKVYVPKYMYPISGILSNFITFSISLLCYVTVWIFFKITGISNGHALKLTWHALFFWVPMLILLIFVVGVGLILSVLQVYFRDVEYIWSVFCTLFFYVVPIVYTMQSIDNSILRLFIKLNPMYSMIELFRQCVLYSQTMSAKMILYSFSWAMISLAFGIFVFTKKSDDLIFHM